MNLQRLVIALGLAGACTVAAAASNPEQAGRQVALHGAAAGGAPCMACHGAHGRGDAAAGFPRLAGQGAAYLAKQLRDFRGGRRANSVMDAAVKNLSDAEITAVAAYYASQHPAPAQRPEGATGGAGEQLARQGDTNAQIPACDSCHGPDGRGMPPTFPALAGQQARYLRAQLDAFHRGDRHNDAGGIMSAVARKLDGAQMDAVANYFANLKPAS